MYVNTHAQMHKQIKLANGISIGNPKVVDDLIQRTKLTDFTVQTRSTYQA